MTDGDVQRVLRSTGKKVSVGVGEEDFLRGVVSLLHLKGQLTQRPREWHSVSQCTKWPENYQRKQRYMNEHGVFNTICISGILVHKVCQAKEW